MANLNATVVKGNLTVTGTTNTAKIQSTNTISTTGQVQAASFYATSDKRLKENIVEYQIEKSVLDLPVYKYDFIDGPKDQIGCLAQDLQEICPEIVNEREDGYLMIQENKLVYLLLEEVKKLREEIKELKKNKIIL